MNLLDVFNDYKIKFYKRKSLVILNYLKIPCITIYFDLSNLPHLLGLHYVVKVKPKLIDEIFNSKFTLKTFSNNKNYKMVIERINNYNFLSYIFYEKKQDVCIVRKDLKRNTMMLDIVFFKEESEKCIVLGLRSDSKTNIYYPTTLHTDCSNKYKQYRKTKILDIKWL